MVAFQFNFCESFGKSIEIIPIPLRGCHNPQRAKITKYIKLMKKIKRLMAVAAVVFVLSLGGKALAQAQGIGGMDLDPQQLQQLQQWEK